MAEGEGAGDEQVAFQSQPSSHVKETELENGLQPQEGVASSAILPEAASVTGVKLDRANPSKLPELAAVAPAAEPPSKPLDAEMRHQEQGLPSLPEPEHASAHAEALPAILSPMQQASPAHKAILSAEPQHFPHEPQTTGHRLPPLFSEALHPSGMGSHSNALQTPDFRPVPLQASPIHIQPLPLGPSSAASPPGLPELFSDHSTPTTTDTPLFPVSATGLLYSETAASSIASPTASSGISSPSSAPMLQTASPGLSSGSIKQRMKAETRLTQAALGRSASPSGRSASPPKSRSARRRPLISLAADAAQHEFLGQDMDDSSPGFMPEPRVDGGLLNRVCTRMHYHPAGRNPHCRHLRTVCCLKVLGQNEHLPCLGICAAGRSKRQGVSRHPWLVIGLGARFGGQGVMGCGPGLLGQDSLGNQQAPTDALNCSRYKLPDGMSTSVYKLSAAAWQGESCLCTIR